MRWLRDCFIALVATLSLASTGKADESSGFYRMLLSTEERALEAVRKRSVRELHAVHNDIMSDVVGDSEGRWKPNLKCWAAYVHLSVPVLLYASAIEPTSSEPVRSEAENAALGDTIWAGYLKMMEECERAMNISTPQVRQIRPSELLHRVLPKLPNEKRPASQ